MITKPQLERSLPFNKNIGDWHAAISDILPKYQITTENRIAGFLGQCAWESNSFTVLRENLNYSKAGLLATFGKYFNEGLAEIYQRHPEQIANRVYANRMSNGSDLSGDGWKYRGRGVIQLTGKYNYSLFAEWSKLDVVNKPEILETDKHAALLSAVWFWHVNGLNSFCDKADWVGLTRRINGGTHGLRGRINKTNRIKSCMTAATPL